MRTLKSQTCLSKQLKESLTNFVIKKGYGWGFRGCYRQLNVAFIDYHILSLEAEKVKNATKTKKCGLLRSSVMFCNNNGHPHRTKYVKIKYYTC